jgi:hypothetical protein
MCKDVSLYFYDNIRHYKDVQRCLSITLAQVVMRVGISRLTATAS